MFRRLPGGWRRNFIQTSRLSIDQRGSAELGVKSRYFRKPKYLQRPKSVFGRYESPWRSNKKNVQDALFLLYSNMKNFFKQKKILNVPEIPQMAVSREAIGSLEKDHFTWLGHATCYVQLQGKYFLTDPIWSLRASPFQNFGPMRYVPPPTPLANLKIDYVLLSHTHYDHYDIATARQIGNRATWIVPKGVKSMLKSIGITNTVELDWWQSHTIDQVEGNEDEAIEVVFTPTQHWSSRSLFDRGTSLWGSYAVLTPMSRFFFTGDTAYCSVFKDIGETYGPFDLAAIPIGAYKPRHFLKDVHCNPAEAVRIHQDLNAKRSVAIHWGTFELSEEEFVEPALELGRVRELEKLDSNEFFTMAHGETLLLGESSSNDLSVLHPHLLRDYIQTYEEEEEEVVETGEPSPPSENLKRMSGALRDSRAAWNASHRKDGVAT